MRVDALEHTQLDQNSFCLLTPIPFVPPGILLGMPPRKVQKRAVQTNPGQLHAQLKRSDSSPSSLVSPLERIPLDMLGEIISYLEPLDVLQLSRTDNCLRDLLMNRAMASYWKRARENVDALPPCPADMSEPAYANLMFTDHCHKCLAEGEDVLTHVEARVQLCYKCTLQEFKKWKDMPQEIDLKLVDFIPATSEALTVSERKQPEQVANSKWRTTARTRFHVETALRLQAQYGELEKPKERTKWMKEQRAAWTSIEEHANLCRDVLRGDQPKNEGERYAFLLQRKAKIRQEMKDLGYEDEFEQCGGFSVEETPLGATMHSRIWTGTKLSEKEWQSIKTPIIAYMEQVRVALLALRKAERLYDWVAARLTPPYIAYILARPANVSSIPTLKQLALTDAIKQHLPTNGDTLDEAVQTDALQEEIERIPELVRNHSSDIEEYLLNLVRQAPPYEGKGIGREALFYATTMFRCATCDASLAFPDVLVHEHFYNENWPSKRRKPAVSANCNAEVDEAVEDDIRAVIHPAVKYHRIWAPGKGIRFNEATYHHSLAVLNLMQMDPSTTSQTLRDLNPYVELLCKCRSRCPGNSKHNRLVNRWSEVIQLVGLHRSMEYGDALRIFDEADAQKMSGYQPKFPPALNWSTSTMCPLCGRFMWDLSHLSQEHNLSQAEAAAVFQQVPKEWCHRRYSAMTLGT